MSISNYEHVYENGVRPHLVRGLTYDQACAAARTRLCQLSPQWCSASCDAIKANVCATPTLFSGTSGEDVDIRCGLGCALPSQSCGSPPPPPPPGGGVNTTLLLALAGIAVVGGLAFYIASKGQKKVVIARVQR